uniref:Hypotheticial protein n=1 Tax=Parastrongyloides trichosuri TaxID=131310 RepID=A0A0N4ZCJ3_PARTI
MNHQTVVLYICYSLIILHFATGVPVYYDKDDTNYYVMENDNNQPNVGDKFIEKRQILNSFMANDGGNKRPHGYSIKGIPLRLMSNFRRIY